jgi:raffinose/stachyose/melibiose transport system permease protein
MRKAGIVFFLLVFIIYAVLPLFIVLVTSVKTEKQMYESVLGVPVELHPENYKAVWVDRGFHRYFLNSVSVTLPTVLIVLVCSSLAGYAFAKMTFKGKELLFYTFLIGLMIPIPSLMIPLYRNLNLVRLLDSRIGLILPEAAFAMPFGIFLMRTFFRGIDDEILEAARIDGAGELRLMVRIMAPLAAPGLKALALIEFMWAWQSYLFPLIIIRSDRLKTLTLGMDLFIGRYTTSYTLIATAAVIVFVPITMVFLLTQRTFIEGLTMGSIK